MIKVTPKIQTAYTRTLSLLLEHSNKDYRNLQLARKAALQQPKEQLKGPNMTFAEGLKNFLENGMMLMMK